MPRRLSRPNPTVFTSVKQREYLNQFAREVELELQKVEQAATSSEGALSFDGLSDVSVANAVSGQYVQLQSGEWVPVDLTQGVTSLSQLSDVSVSTAVSGDFLRLVGDTWQGEAIRSNPVLVTIVSVEGNTSVAYTEFSTSAVRVYVKFRNLRFSNNSSPQMKFTQNTSTLEGNNYYYGYARTTIGSNGTPAGTGGSLSGDITLGPTVDTSVGIHGELIFEQPNASVMPNARWSYTHRSSGTAFYLLVQGGAYYRNTDAHIDGFALYPTFSVNMSGSFEVWEEYPLGGFTGGPGGSDGGSTVTSLSQLSDVSVSTAVSGDTLRLIGDTWTNETPPIEAMGLSANEVVGGAGVGVTIPWDLVFTRNTEVTLFTSDGKVSIPPYYSGRYVQLGANSEWDTNSTGWRQFDIQFNNGTSTRTVAISRHDANSGTVDFDNIVTYPIRVSTGDEFYTRAIQNSGSNIDFKVNGSFFWIRVL